MVLTLVVAVAVAYVLGAIPTGYLVARAFGVHDLRSRGSGNIGATNVLRTVGRLPAVCTLIGDVVKGYVAVTVAGVLAAGDAPATAAGAVAAVIGNCWSVFLGFRGGKGMATGLGALVRLVPLATVPAVVVWVAIAATFRYASLASITAAICVPLGTLAFGYGAPRIVAALLTGGIILARHRENIDRLLAGTERRLGERTPSA